MFRFTRNLTILSKFDLSNTIKRYPHFDADYVKPNLSDLPSYKISNDPKEWEYVERLLPPTHIPDPPTENKRYPSGWKPQTAKPGDYPYYIKRSRSHFLPLYLKISHRGMKRHTSLKYIHGDIWALADELKEYLSDKNPKGIGLRVSEISGEIRIMGDHVSDIKMWLEKKNF